MENPIFKILNNINQEEQEQNNNSNSHLSGQNTYNNSSNNMNSGMNLNNNINNNMNNNLNNNMNYNNNMNNMGMNNNMNMNNMNYMNNPMFYNQGMGMNNMNNYGMNPGMNMFPMNPMNQMMNNNNMNIEDQNLFRLKYLLGNVQQNLLLIMNDINEIETILTSMKNEGLDNNPNFFNFRNQFNQMLSFNNNFNNNIMMNENYKITVIFRKSGAPEKQPPTMIECYTNEKVKDVIQRYKIKALDNNDRLKFIFNAKNLNPESTVAEIGLSNNSNIFVVKC